MNNFMRIVFIIFIICSIHTGCATMTPQQKADLERIANRQIICTKGSDCDEKWGRAIVWVSNNSGWKIQTQTDNLISTFGPSDRVNTTANAFQVNKVPLGNDRYQIVINGRCGNIFGCVPDTLSQIANFNQYVLGQ